MPDGAPGAPGSAGDAPGTWAGQAGDASETESGPAGGPAETPPGPAAATPRGPGWREVLVLAAAMLAAVLALEIASAALPPVREAFRGFPVTVVVLVAGTVGLLLLGVRRRPRP